MSTNATAPTATRSGIRRVNRGRGHSYEIDGKRVPGVTTLLSAGLPKPALSYWAAREVATYVADAEPETLDSLRTLGRDGMIEALKKIPWQNRDKAAIVGTQVHKYAEALVKGQRIEYPDEYAGYVESAVAFMDDWLVSPLLTEATVASRRWSYAGTCDGVVDLPDKRRMILDYKTGKSGVFPEVALQLAAYRWAEIFIDPAGEECQMETLGIDGGMAVHLRQDCYEVIPVNCGPEVFNAFLHIAHVARRIEEMPTWLGEPELPAVRS